MSIQETEDQPALERRVRASDAYARQIAQVARALAEGRVEDIVSLLAPGCTESQVALFIESNYGKRVETLLFLLDDMSGEFSGLADLAIDFVNEAPMQAVATAAEEVDYFLGWILQNKRLSTADRDTLHCHKARFGLDRLARRRRGEHLLFQRLVERSAELRHLLDCDAGLRLRFNPICVRVRLRSPRYLEGDTPPAEVLFYAAGAGNRTSLLAPTSLPLVDALADLVTCTLDQWAERVYPAQRDDLVELASELVEAGIVALDDA